MASLIHPGWLLLLICTLLLLLVGCRIMPSRTPMPSVTPPLNITLTVLPRITDTPQPRSTRPVATAGASFYPVGVPTWQRLDAPPRIQHDLYIENPLCSSTYSGYSCLGRVWNYGLSTVQDVTLRVRMRDQDEILTRYFSLEQRMILPGTFAPYRIIFANAQLEEIEGVAALSYPERTLVPLTIVDERGTYSTNGRYVITTSIRNDSNYPLEQIRTVATVVDEWDRVVGYRIQERNLVLEVGENVVFRLEMNAQVGEINHHYLHAEGQPSY